MIFSIDKHIEQIILGVKTQTRRPTHRYEKGKTYAIQSGRGKKAIPDGRIRIDMVWWEEKMNVAQYPISDIDAYREGRYSWEEFEDLYEKMYPGWQSRCAYQFKFIPHNSRGKMK